MKITFLTPPSFDGHKPAERTAGCTRVVYDMPNIYELTVAAVLEKEGFEVCYKNFVLDNASKEDCYAFIRNDDSQFYILWTVNLSLATDLKLQQIVKEESPFSARTVFMGPGATYFVRELLEGDPRSIVVRGEPEVTTLELFRLFRTNASTTDEKKEDWDRQLSDIRGISYTSYQHHLPVHNPPRPLIPDLDALPFPAIHLIRQYHFFNPKLKVTPYMSMVTSRNCPYRCIYCVPSSLTFAREMEYKKEHEGKKPPVGFRSTANVVAEIESLAQQGFRAIGFMDDNFIVTAKRLREIGEALKKQDIAWGCQARVDAITEEIAKMLRDYGCRYVDLGVESFNDDILKYIKKGITKEQIYKAVHLLKQYEVPVKLNILIGTSPLETPATVKDTLRRAKALKVDQVMFNIVSPFPTTEFYDMAKENGWIEGGEYKPTDVQRSSILNYPHLSSRQMEHLLFRNNLYFFLSPSFIWKNIGKFASFKDFRVALKALKIKLFG